jgi:hypothetical protein
MALNNFVGMFGHTVQAEIKNINLVNSSVEGVNFVGALIGFSNQTVVSNCTVTGDIFSVKGSQDVGGLIGKNYNNSPVINSSSYIGVFAGMNSERIGGLIGTNTFNCPISKCKSLGRVLTIGGSYIGGLVGMNAYSDISECFSTGDDVNVSGNTHIGGLIGQNSDNVVTNCYSTAKVTGGIFRGGLIGYTTNSTVSYCFSKGEIPESSSLTGGLIGEKSNSVIVESFWDTETSLWLTSAGGTPKTTEEMKIKSTFKNAGWNFLTTWGMVGTTNNGYPHFLIPPTAEAPTQGDGTVENPYQLSHINHLYWVSQNTGLWNKYFLQTADIDAFRTGALEKGWTPIGNSSTAFTGSYNGGGYKIDGLYINQNTLSYVGMFGLSSGAEIKNTGLTNITIAKGGSSATGGLVAYIYSSTKILSCYTTGSVFSAGNLVGGLVGLSNSSKIINCFSHCSVQGNNQVGGLLGWNSTSGLLKYAYSTGSVTGSTNTGGLVGTNAASVIMCLWNTETSGQATSAGGTGKTTAELKDMETFLNVGWNLIVLWKINSAMNEGYPHLQALPEAPIAVYPSSGNGSTANPYQIANINNLYWITQNTSRWTANYIQTADIDASSTAVLNDGDGWVPLGNSSVNFTGNYNGQNFKISGLYINRSSTNYIGLFGILSGSSTTISNLGLENSQITGALNTGALTGYVSSKSIVNCFSNGFVRGGNYVGGLIGYTSTNATVKDSYTEVSVKGSAYVGGVVGYLFNSSYVGNTYSNATVAGSTAVGGLIGMIDTSNKIVHCYSRGAVTGYGGLIGATLNPVSAVVGCFWDTETSGKTTSVGGTGKTTQQMKTASTYTNAGWSLTHIWSLTDENNGYPILRRLPFITPVAEQPLGAGTVESPYQISKLSELLWISNSPSSNYIQTADIDASETAIWNGGSGWNPISNFSGKYNGQNFSINGLCIDRKSTDYVGFIRNMNYTATISNLHFSNVSIIGNNNIGTLCSNSYSGAAYATDTTVQQWITVWNNNVGVLIGLSKV